MIIFAQNSCFMEQFKQILQTLQNLPVAGKVLTVIIATLVAIVLLFFHSSCSVVQSVNTGDGNTNSTSGSMEVVIDSVGNGTSIAIPSEFPQYLVNPNEL